MTELGIDSLAIVEFADEVEKLFKKQFPTDDLSNMSLQALMDACGSGSTGGAPVPAGASTPSRVIDHDAEGTVTSEASDESFGFIDKAETVAVKDVDGVSVEVDVYVPKAQGSKLLGVALLDGGFLPVNMNYRLCPEVSLVDGPMADVLDVYRWVIDELPAFASKRGLSIDSKSVVAVGWSSGGHLAMALEWMSRAAGLPALKAVLSFYPPVAWASGGMDANLNVVSSESATNSNAAIHPQSPRNNLSEKAKNDLKLLIQESTRFPRTHFNEVLKHGFATHYSSLKWVREDDMRSQLIGAALVPGHCLPLLMRGFPASMEDADLEACLQPVETARLEAICPLTQAQRGLYRTPTFIIHGFDDDIVPLSSSEEFCSALRAAGVSCQLLAVPGAGHAFDYGFKYGGNDWNAIIGPGFKFLSHRASL
ncbi:polyketide synthase [Colletotrichum tofieldiae]|nr:polyketide synthase [Colletotrichum tofieldiae]